jgi:hypothetical protein
MRSVECLGNEFHQSHVWTLVVSNGNDGGSSLDIRFGREDMSTGNLLVQQNVSRLQDWVRQETKSEIRLGNVIDRCRGLCGQLILWLWSTSVKMSILPSSLSSPSTWKQGI